MRYYKLKGFISEEVFNEIKKISGTKRVALDYVIDFLDFRIWPVFNVADSAITVGVIVALVSIYRSDILFFDGERCRCTGSAKSE